MSDLWHELRLAVRVLGRHRLVSLVVILTLGLGIGANLAVFSVVRATLLEPLPFERPAELTSITWAVDGGSWSPLSPSEFEDLRDETESLAALGAYHPWTFNVSGGQAVERLTGAVVTASLPAVLGVSPTLGPGFQADEDPGGPAEVLLSDGLWQRRFGGEPSVIGRTILLDEKPATIVGVMPAEFRFPLTRPGELWKKAAFDPELPREMRFLIAIGRTVSERGTDAVDAEMTLLAETMARAHPKAYDGLSPRVESLRDTMVRTFEQRLVLLQLAVGAALLLACFNVAMVQLGRAESRRAETAMRYALGAGRLQVLRQSLWENVILGLAGGALGAVVAALGSEILIRLGPQSIHRLDEARMGVAELTLTLLLGLACGVLVGFAPSLVTQTRRVIGGALGSGQRTSAGQTLRRVLVATQVAVTLVLIVAFGLFVRSLERLGGVELGFDPDPVVATGVSLFADDVDPRSIQSFVGELQRRLRDVPGVEAVATAVAPPLGGGFRISHPFTLVGEEREADAAQRNAAIRPVSPGFFELLEIPLLAGRPLETSDSASAEPVVVVNEAFARDVLGDTREALGRQLEIALDYGAEVGRLPHPRWRVVGVVGDVRQDDLGRRDVPAVYVSTFQSPWAETRILVRATGSAETLAPTVEAAVREAAPDLPVSPAKPLRAVAETQLAPVRFQSSLLGVFAALAVFLTALGLYGTLSYSVVRRSREIGLRMALGAGRSAARWLIVRQALTTVTLGTVLGLLGCWWLARLVESLLYDVSPSDPRTYAAAVALMVTIGFVAGWWPARRATRVDPAVCLREE